MHGVLVLQGPLKRSFFVVGGGSITCAPQGVYTVGLAEEIYDIDVDYKIPIQDFDIPSPELLDVSLPIVMEPILKGIPVYFGCRGGRGRTGLLLSLIAKAWGIERPVDYVRKNYYYHAVETVRQFNFVEEYPIPASLRRLVWWTKVGMLFSSGNLTEQNDAFDKHKMSVVR